MVTPDKIDMRKNAFIANQVQSGVFNQVKGDDITGYFKDKEMDHMDVAGSAESVFFVQDDEKAFVGVNKSTSENMELVFADKEVDKIKFVTRPIAEFVPMQQVQISAYMLDGFQWCVDERPNIDLFVVEQTEAKQWCLKKRRLQAININLKLAKGRKTSFLKK